MKSFSTDFSTAIANHDAPVTFAIIKMPSGDVYIADAPYGIANGLPFDCIDIIENISEENDGSSLESYFSPGNLETGKLTINLIYSDKSRSMIHGLINEGISRRRVEVWKWFVDPATAIGTCAPVLWNIYAIQDNSEGFQTREDRQLFPIELITLPASENRKLSVTSKSDTSYDFIIGRAEGLQLKLIEDESDNWTQLLGDQDGKEIDDSYTGLIRVEDATRLSAGEHLVNGEQVTLASASAGYMELTARAQNFTGAQEHGNGSRIFPLGAVFKYAVCAGPIGSLELLRTSNEIDIYDEDGDLDTTEYRDLYSGGNEELHPELNPAQIWFNGRMPWLKRDQELDLSKVFYGQQFIFSDAIFCKYPADINKETGKAELQIPYAYLTIGGTGALESNESPRYCPSLAGDGSTYSGSDSIDSGHFDVEQVYGDPGYREFRVNSSATPGEEATTMIAIFPPAKGAEFYNYEQILLAIPTVIWITSRMSIKMDVVKVIGTLGEQILWTSSALGEFQGETEHTVLTDQVSYVNMSSIPAGNDRLMFRVTCLANNDPNSYGYVRIGGETVAPEGNTSYQSIIAFWAYRNAEPIAWVESKFSRNLSSRGDFVSAEARVTGVVRNNNNKALGTIKVYDGLIVAESVEIPQDGSDIEFNLTLSASSWVDLLFSSVRVEMQLTGLDGVLDNGAVSIELEGVEWIISYVSSNLDGIQVNYTDQLYVDATSSRGADWTPARGVQYIAEDYTNWSDIINTVDFDARHAEYQAAGHYLNGTVSGSTGAQDAIRAILKEGLAVLNPSRGEIKLLTYITDGAAVSTLSAPYILRPDRMSMPSRGFALSANELHTDRYFFYWNKNLSTGKYDGEIVKTNGTNFINDQVLNLDLISSDTVGNAIADFLWNLSKNKYVTQECEYVIEDSVSIEKHDIITTLNMINGDAIDNFFVVSCGFTHESAKLKRRRSVKAKMIRRQ